MEGPEKLIHKQYIRIITSIIILTLAFLEYHVPVDGDPLVLYIESCMHVREVRVHYLVYLYYYYNIIISPVAIYFSVIIR